MTNYNFEKLREIAKLLGMEESEDYKRFVSELGKIE